MGLFRRGKKWYMAYTVDGKPYREPTGTGDRKRAEKIYGKILADIEDGRWFENQAKRKTLKEMLERYEQEYSVSKDYYQSRRDKGIFKHLYSFFGEEATLKEVEAKIGQYELFRRKQVLKRSNDKDPQPPQPATIMKELSLLRRIFTVARKQWKWKVNNPVSDIELPKVRNDRVRYLADEEKQRLFKSLETGPSWLKSCVVIAIGTGLRLGNVTNLNWSEVNLFSRMIAIDAEKMKNDDHLGLPVIDSVLEELKELHKVKCLTGHVIHDEGTPLYPVKIQRAFKEALKRAEIENFHFHDLRHCFCSYLRQQGVDLHTIAILAGHRDLRMTKRYAHLNVDSLRQAISRLEISVPILSQSADMKRAETA